MDPISTGQTVSPIAAIKKFFERSDSVAPEGGRKCEITELKALSEADKLELGPLCAAALGMELQIKN